MPLAIITLLPPPPNNWLSPPPPIIILSPDPPRIMSLPPKPIRIELPLPPVIRSSPSDPITGWHVLFDIHFAISVKIADLISLKVGFLSFNGVTVAEAGNEVEDVDEPEEGNAGEGGGDTDKTCPLLSEEEFEDDFEDDCAKTSSTMYILIMLTVKMDKIAK